MGGVDREEEVTILFTLREGGGGGQWSEQHQGGRGQQPTRKGRLCDGSKVPWRIGKRTIGNMAAAGRHNEIFVAAHAAAQAAGVSATATAIDCSRSSKRNAWPKYQRPRRALALNFDRLY